MRTALLVDDQADVRLLMELALGEELATIEAASGVAALELLLTLDEVPAVIVLDAQMPDMDGWDTLARIRADPRTAHVPVVLCTVKTHHRDLIRGWQLGCDGYVVKPFDLDTLRQAVRTALQRDPAERVRTRIAMCAELERARDAA